MCIYIYRCIFTHISYAATTSISCFSQNRYGVGFFPQKKGGPRWLDGWAGAGLQFGSLHVSFLGSWAAWVPLGCLHVCFLGSTTRRGGLRWTPFMFPLWDPGCVGHGEVGSIAQISCFLSGLSRMGGPRRRGIGLPSCLLSGLLGWMNGPRQQRLGSGLLGRMGGPRRGGVGCIGLPSCFLSGLLGRTGFLSGLGRMGGPRRRGGLPLAPFIIGLPSLSGSWVGWVGTAKSFRSPKILRNGSCCTLAARPLTSAWCCILPTT